MSDIDQFTSPDNVAAQIDAMVAGRDSVEPTRVQKGESATFNTFTGEITTDADPAARVVYRDDGTRDLQGEFARLADQRAALYDKTVEITGFSKTAEPIFKYSEGERASFQRQMEQLDESIRYQRSVSEAILKQRQDREEAKARKEAEAAARLAFSKGDPARARAFDAAVVAEEARQAAMAVVSARLK